MKNIVFTRLSALEGDKIRVQVQSDDLGGGNQAGVHLFDKKLKYVDVPLAWKERLGGDDLFEGEIPLSSLPKDFDTSDIRATGWVDIPDWFGPPNRFWEQYSDHPVLPP